MGRKPAPSFRLTLVLEFDDEIHSLVLTDDRRFRFSSFAEIESSTSIKLLEAHLSRIEEPRRLRPPSPRRRERPRKRASSPP